MKKNKGITMIALIITIIILLILAGVSIALLTGKNGIIKKAELAKQKSEEAELEENEILSDYENKIGKYINGTKNENENNYSTNEVKIGTWIDGKPLYRKVITGLKSPSQNGVWKNIYTEPDAEMLMVEKLLFYTDNGKILELNYAEGVGIFYAIYRNEIQSYISVNQSNFGNKDMLLILNYTKATDTTENN